MSRFRHTLEHFHLFLMLDPSIHPKFWQTCGELQLLYIPQFLCFKSNFLELETQIYSILLRLLSRELKLDYNPGHLFFQIFYIHQCEMYYFQVAKGFRA